MKKRIVLITLAAAALLTALFFTAKAIYERPFAVEASGITFGEGDSAAEIRLDMRAKKRFLRRGLRVTGGTVYFTKLPSVLAENERFGAELSGLLSGGVPLAYEVPVRPGAEGDAHFNIDLFWPEKASGERSILWIMARFGPDDNIGMHVYGNLYTDPVVYGVDWLLLLSLESLGDPVPCDMSPIRAALQAAFD